MVALDAEFPDGNLDALAVQGNQVEDMKLSIVNKSKDKKYELGTSDLKAYEIKTGTLNAYHLITYATGYRQRKIVRPYLMASGPFFDHCHLGDYDIKYSQRTKDDPQTLTKNCSYEVEYHLQV